MTALRGNRFSRRAVLLAGLSTAVPVRASGFRSAKVVAVKRHGVLELESGRTVVMQHLRIPQIPAPFGFEAFAGLNDLLEGRDIIYLPSMDGADRFGNLRASVWYPGDKTLLGDSIWERVVRQGLARIFASGTYSGVVPEMWVLEAEARAARHGLWAERAYDVRAADADRLAQDMETHQIVEGIVTDAQSRGSRTFLNFGSDYRTDFTVVVTDAIGKRLAEPSETLSGARVQVRGFIEMVNGPSLWLTHPDNLRILD